MSVVSSTVRTAHYCPEAQTARSPIEPAAVRNVLSLSLKSIRQGADVRRRQGTTSHTRVPSCKIPAAYRSSCQGSGEIDIANDVFGSSLHQAFSSVDSNDASSNEQQQRPSSPSGMVALMEAWGHLSTRLQPSNSIVAGTANSSLDEATDDATTQLILSALKLAVRSLSRVPDSPGSAASYSTTNGSSKPAVQRSLALAAALAELYADGLPLDAASIAAGIVADAVDAAVLHIRTVQAKLGQEVAGLVHDVLAVRHAPDKAQIYDDANSSALRGWLLTAYDVRACAIEVVWRWLGLAQPPVQLYQQQLLAMEALTIYCPLGHALGLGVCSTALEDSAFKVTCSIWCALGLGVCPTALEDSAFKVLFPSSYASTARQVLPFSAAAAALLAHCTAAIQAAAAADKTFSQLASGVQLLSRTKSLYSIMRKLLRLQDPAAGSRRLGDMFDLLGLRAVVLPREDMPAAAAEAAAVEACYRLQELAHQQWSPVPGRTKDYIKHPKANGYQSLHSTLQLQQQQQQTGGSSSSSNDQAVVLTHLELQIRTAAMHAAAEGGDAAHAGYKGRLEQRQVRHLQQWTAQLQRRLAAPQQQLLLTLPHAYPSSSSSVYGSSDQQSGALLQPSYSRLNDSSSSDSDSDSSSSSSSKSSSALAASWQQQQQQQLLVQQPGAAPAAAASLFHHLDLDGDGMLSLYELTQLLSELGELHNINNIYNTQSNMLLFRPAAAAAAVEQGSSSVASNGSEVSSHLQSTLTPVAAAAAAASGSSAAAYAQQVFELLDTNGDGLISMSEFLEFYLANTHQQQQPQRQRQQQQQQVGRQQPQWQVKQQRQQRFCAAAAMQAAEPRGTVRAAALHRSCSSSSSSSWRQQRQRPPGVPVSSSSWLSSGSSSSSGDRMRHRTRCWAYPRTNAAAAAGSSSGSSTDNDSSRSGSSEQQQQMNDQQGQQISPPAQSTAAAADLAAVTRSSIIGSSSSSSSDSDADQTDDQQQQQRDDNLQQQLQIELSFEEDEQQQQRQLRQQQRQLPSLLADAAAYRAPRYVLIPVRSSSSSIFADAVPFIDRQGQQMQQVEVPCLGPLLVTNAPQIFKSAAVVIDGQTEYYDRFALLLELVKRTGSSEAVLQARNLSRVVRKRLVNATMTVNGGQTLLEPHRAAVELLDGDTLEVPELGASFVVRLLDDQLAGKFAGHPATLALQQYCGVYASQQLGLPDLPVQQAIQQCEQQQQQQVGAGVGHKQLDYVQQRQQQRQDLASSSSSSQPLAGDQYPNLESDLKQVSRLVRTDARAAEVALSTLAVAHPAAAGPWFLWAQLAASTRRHWMARDLFRAAALCQQQQLDQLRQGGAAAAAAAAALQLADGEEAEAVAAAGSAVAGLVSSASSVVGPAAAAAVAAATPDPSSRSSKSRKSKAQRSPEFRLSSRLVQVLRVWAKLEWDQRFFGPARRLWRLAANEAFRFPYDIAAEGGGAVLHAWATAEFERDNVLNARVVIGEALRKCPKDAAVAVLAASIEAAAGEYNAARALFLRAYQLNKADKVLWQYWPKMEGATGNVERARLLFQYGLSLYPNNTKILNKYACFEEEQGNLELARELHRRALGIDNTSLTAMHNRVSWANLELREGNIDDARELLREGLDAHPDFQAAMLLLSKLERQQGNLDLAEAYARRVQKLGHPFSVAAMGELREIYQERGEDLLADNLSRHIGSTRHAQSKKKAGQLHGNEAWISFYQQSASVDQQAVIAAARERKRDLGLFRQPRGRSHNSSSSGGGSSSSGRRGGNGRGSSSQRGQQQGQELVNGSSGSASMVDSFDFGAASAATADQFAGRNSFGSRAG